MSIGVNIPLVDRTEINGATDVVPGTHKLSPLLGYGGRQPNRPEHEPDYNKLLIQVLVLFTSPSIPICFDCLCAAKLRTVVLNVRHAPHLIVFFVQSGALRAFATCRATFMKP